MKIDKRKLMKGIQQRWDSPQKLLEYMLDFEKQIDLEKETIARNILLEDIKNYSIAVAYTLNYKYGFGRKRLPGVMEEIMKTFDCFTSGHLNIEDCKSELDRAGVVIK